MSEDKRMNPDIKVFNYGKREQKELTIYPLSIGDQFKVTNIITEVVRGLVEAQAEKKLSDFAFMTAVMKSLESNLGEVLSLVADIPKEDSVKVINELTNPQLIDIVDIIWSVNYEPALKKGIDLFERGKQLFASRRSSPSSSSTTLNTDLKTSTEKAIN